MFLHIMVQRKWLSGKLKIDNKNPINSGATLQALIATANHRQSSIPGAASAYTRLTGLKPRLDLPTIPSPQSEENKVKIQQKLDEYRDKVSKKVKRSTHKKFKIGDELYIFNSGTKKLDEKGAISSLTPNENAYPTSFHVKMRGGPIRLVNQAWLHPVPSC